jgi:branched-chain amino acid transport system permease protein
MVTVVFDGLALGALLFLVSVGLSVTMGLMNFVNLAHGTFAMAGGYAAALVMNDLDCGFVLALVVAFFTGALTAALIEILFVRRLYKSHPLDQVLFTFGLVFASVAIATFLFGATLQPFKLPKLLAGEVHIFGVAFSSYRLLLIAVSLLIAASLAASLNFTRFGAMVRAAVDNQRVARGSGIDVGRLFLLTFALGGGLAGFGAALGLGMLPMSPIYPLKYMAFFLMVACVGGAGTIAGPLIAAMLIGVGDVAGKYYVPQLGGFLIYFVLLLLLLVRPQGIIVKRGAT